MPLFSSPIGILQYNAGNVGSVAKALTRLAIPSRVVEDREGIEAVSGLIFPGAGAAKSAMNELQERGLLEILREFQKPFLGLCLGMQLLFDHSNEGDTACLGIVRGNVRELPVNVIKPHMGWNMLRQHDTAIGYAYFVHSYVCVPKDPSIITMTVPYGSDLCAGIRQGNFFGVQWHPEKSGAVGDRYLRSFAELCT